MDVLNAVQAFFADTRTLTLLALIALDLVAGIIQALRTGIFEWREVARFYRSNVVPGLLGYATVYVLAAVGVEKLPQVGPVLEALTQWAGYGVLLAALVASIGRNLGQGLAPPAPLK